MDDKERPALATVVVHLREPAPADQVGADLLDLLAAAGAELRCTVRTTDPRLAGAVARTPASAQVLPPAGVDCWVAVATVPHHARPALHDALAHLAARHGLPSVWLGMDTSNFVVRAAQDD